MMRLIKFWMARLSCRCLRPGSLLCLALGLLLVPALPAWAGFSIMGTRVIYEEAEGEATVQLQRVTGEQPVLLQAWLDDGNPEARPGTQDLPFLVVPAVSRVDPGDAQVVRILRIRDDLPADRESLLFFNALEVPSAVENRSGADANVLQLAMQARMKFFYRPRNLEPSSVAAAGLLRFSVMLAAGGVLQLRVHNPTPYHITMPNLGLYAANAADDAAPLAKFEETGIAPMVAPFDDLIVDLSGLGAGVRAATLAARPAAELQVRYTVINDQGGINPKTTALGNVAS